MKHLMIFSFICYLAFTITIDLNSNIECLNIFTQNEVLAQSNSDDSGGAKNYFLRSAIFLAGVVVIWFIFYKLVYPFLRKYYSSAYSQTLFWSMFLLYFMAWITISAYVIFEVGFYYHWLKWVFVFFGAIWFIWLLVVLLKKDDRAAYYG